MSAAEWVGAVGLAFGALLTAVLIARDEWRARRDRRAHRAACAAWVARHPGWRDYDPDPDPTVIETR
jgi:hypothetical protein